MNLSKKGLIIVISLALIIAAAVGAYFAFFHNPVIEEFVFETVPGERKVIPLPERTRHEVDGFYITFFVSDLSAEEIIEFYDDYVSDFKKVMNDKQHSDQIYFYDEAQQIVIKYDIFREDDDGTCEFSIAYDDFSENWRIMKG